MRTKKISIAALLIGALFFLIPGKALAVDDATVTQIQNDAVNAKNKANGNQDKITGLYDNVANLQQQIDNIALTPGPPGPQGPQGEPGPSHTGRGRVTGTARLRTTTPRSDDIAFRSAASGH